MHIVRKSTENLAISRKVRIFADEKIRTMAKPIAATPVLKGQAAIDFVEELSKNKKATTEEKARINAGADRIQAMLSFAI